VSRLAQHDADIFERIGLIHYNTQPSQPQRTQRTQRKNNEIQNA
jgi:hypothetical protein